MHKTPRSQEDAALDGLAERPTETLVMTLDYIRQLQQLPHCDPRVLHAPGECEYCDRHPSWQALRAAWGVCFTGYSPDDTELPDPAMYARGETLERWHGNRPSK